MNFIDYFGSIDFFFFNIYLFIYLFALGLSCSRQATWLCLASSLAVACELLVAACVWDLVPQPGIEPRPPPLGVQSLSTAPPGKSLDIFPVSIYLIHEQGKIST